MTIKVVKQKITIAEVEKLAQETYREMIKGVADLRLGIIALGGEMHSDAEAVLLQHGSRQEDLWGFNIYPEKPDQERIEYSSLINIKPAKGNRSMVIKDLKLKDKVKKVINAWVE
jgi:hypothetical protein